MTLKKIISVLFCIVLPLFLLLLSYQFTVTFFSQTPAQENTLKFLAGKEESTLNYTTPEISHLNDVAQVMKSAEIVLFLSGIIILGVLFYFRKDKEQRWRLLKYGGASTITFVLIILAALFFNFNSLFTLFHQLFFPQGNWQFAADSLLIQTFPIEFFVNRGRRIFVLALVFGGMMIGIAYLLKRKMKTKN